MNSLFSSILLIVVPAMASIILFLRIKLNHISQARKFLFYYALGFLISSFSAVLFLLVNMGINISQFEFNIFYSLSVVVKLISYVMFFKGTMLLLTEERFFTTTLPLLIIPVISIFVVAALFYLKFSLIIVYTAIFWGFLSVNSNILGSIFIGSFLTGSPINVFKGKPCGLILGLAWFLTLGLDFYLWFVSVSFPSDFWFLNASSMIGWHILRIIVYLLVFTGALGSVKCCIQALKGRE